MPAEIPSGPGIAGVVRGVITQAGPVAWSWKVKVPRLHGDAELGPFQGLAGLVLVAGDRVVLGPVEGRSDDYIVLGKLS